MQNELQAKGLRVCSKQGEVFTTSLNVARVFGTSHEEVILEIERIVNSLIDSLLDTAYGIKLANKWFPVSSFISTKTGKRQAFYRISSDGFAVLALRLTGKSDYLSFAGRKMADQSFLTRIKQALKQMVNRYVATLELFWLQIKTNVSGVAK